MVDLLIRGGTVVTPSAARRAHVLIHDGRVLDVVERDGELPAARQVVDATGLYVLPGLIDPHVHFREPGYEYKEDWMSGSMAAAAGGFTTVIDMPNVNPPTQDVEALRCKLERALGRSYVDFALYGVITGNNLDQIEPLAAAGVCGFKVFMGETVGGLEAPSDGELLEALRRAAQVGLRVGVHAENRSIVSFLQRRLQQQGRRDPLAHVESRPPVAEAEAIARAVLLARAARAALMVFHMSSREGVELVAWAREAGDDVMAETAPHYLLLEDQDMVRRGLGAIMKINPPIRSREHQQALWEGIDRGIIEVLGTDHSPHTPQEKMEEAPFDDIWKAAPGWPGVETAVPLMLTQVNAGRLSLQRLVQLSAEGPARAWKLWPRKGSLRPGADGDVTIVDLHREGVIDRRRLHSKSKVTPFHGFAVRGMPVYTIVRGRIVMREGEIVGLPAGQWVRPQGS